MNTNRLTQKSMEAVQKAQSIAVEYSNQTLQPEHLLLSLLSQQDSLNAQLFTRMGVDIKIKCNNCGREIMMDRLEFQKKLKKVLKNEEIKES